LGSEHLTFSQDGKRLALAAGVMFIRPELPRPEESRVLVWELATGKKLLDLKGDFSRNIALSPDGGRIATSRGSARAGDPPRRPGGPGRPYHVVMWDVATGKELAVWKEVGSGLTFSPDGSRLASVPGLVNIVIWDAGTGNRLMTIPPPGGNDRV